MELIYISRLNKIFVAENERQIGVIGEGYLKKYLSTESLKVGGFGIVTNKRIYFGGRFLSKKFLLYTRAFNEFRADLKDVEKAEIVNHRNAIFLIFNMIFSLWGAFSLAGTLVCLLDKDWEITAFYFLAGVVPTVVLWILYWLIKTKLLIISCNSISSGKIKIAFKLSDYTEEEIEVFHKAVMKMKDGNVL